jgi:glycosyltransferase involved in cell wall biosynthesis
MKRVRAILIGPMPPPIGGDTVLTLNMSRSRYWRESGIELALVNTSAGDRVRLYEERLGAGDVLRGLRIVARASVEIPRSGAVLLWANSRFLCTAGLAIVLLCRLLRKPLLVKAFGTSLVQRMEEYRPLRRRFTASILDKITYLLAETNGFVRWLVDDAGLAATRVVHVPNMIPDESFKGSFARRRFSGKCIFVGQIKREKGVFDIIEALKGESEDFRCDFFGQLVDRDREEFLERISGRDNLRYKGIIEPGGVCDVIRGYDALLLPTYHGGEGYPAVLLEAMAAGVPVVTTNWRSISEIVPDEVRGMLIPVKSPEALRDVLMRFSSDQDLYNAIAKNAYEYVNAFSEKEIVGNTIIGLIKDALTRR